MLNAIKMLGLGIIGMIIIAVIGITIFLYTSPQFGGKPSKEEIVKFEETGHYNKGKFQNLIETSMDMSFSNFTGMIKDMIKGNPNTEPKFDLPVIHVDSINIDTTHENRLIWFGHSAFLLQMDGQNILIDPMLGDCPSPHPLVGRKRYNKELAIEIDQLPQIDAIIISHDHYDHLDYPSIKKLKDKTAHFFVPLGVGAHLRSWGVKDDKIEELDWWNETTLANIQFVFAPSRHFSGRGIADISSTLWGSWVIIGSKQKVYFSGDGGYGAHFTEIGEKYGPFDFAMMECGQYNKRWSEIHMFPEQTAQAAYDVKARIMMPIHWGAFTLSLHDWNDPVKRVIKKANELEVPITVPMIGQSISLDKVSAQIEEWWLKEKAL
jgi:L-ascorbate metabolism protein UlaG (beta-lactamase superfamily)